MAQITETSIKRIRPPRKGHLLIHDEAVTGFCARVSPRGTCTYLWYGSFEGEPIRVTLGRYPGTPVEQARADALAIREGLALGKHPTETQTLREGLRWGRERLLKRLVAIADQLAAEQFHSIDELKRALSSAIDDAGEPAFNLSNRAWLSRVVLGYLKLAPPPSLDEAAQAAVLLTELLK